MLFETINKDMIEAMKAKDKNSLSVLRSIKGALQLEKINNHKEMTDEVVIDVLSKQIKMRNDSIKEFEKASRNDLVEAYQQEIEILKKYMPKQMTEEELEEVISNVFVKINPTSIKELGLIMREITPLVKGKCDMSVVNTKIRERLNTL